MKNVINEKYLKDEVRDGFMIPSAIKQAWAAELEVLLEIERVCKKHNIQYFADWGTFLGAVRHGGFIPWDDDLDIVMKREDYKRFMTIARIDMEDEFHVQTYENQDDFWLFMGKVVGKNYMCFEKEHLQRFHNFPYIACVDIFVLDYVHPNEKLEDDRRTLCKYILGVADAIVEGRVQGADKERNLKRIEEMLQSHVALYRSIYNCDLDIACSIKRISDPTSMGRFLYHLVEELFSEVPEEKAEKLTQLFPWGLKGDSFQFDKSDYEKHIDLPFECMTIPVPAQFNKLLARRYGDYLKIVKDAGAHDYPFFEGQKRNLLKVLDFDLPRFQFDDSFFEQRKELYDQNKSQSYKELAKECIKELSLLTRTITEDVRAFPNMSDKEMLESLDYLQICQQLAIDLGNLIEEIRGVGTNTVTQLEKYCEQLFQIYQFISEPTPIEIGNEISLKSNLKGLLDEFRNQIEKCNACLEQEILSKKDIVFLPLFAEDWCTLEKMWRKYINDETYNVYVIPLPYYYKEYDESPKEILCDKDKYPEYINTLDYRDYTIERMKLIQPDCIFIQNPYDKWNVAYSVAPSYYIQNLGECSSNITYVAPYLLSDFDKSNGREYQNMKYYVTTPGVMYADKVMVQSEKLRQAYVDKLVDSSGEAYRQLWSEKVSVCKMHNVVDEEQLIARTNISQQEKEETPTEVKKKICYCISLGCLLEHGEKALEKIESSIDAIHKFEKVEIQLVTYPEINPNVMELNRELFAKYDMLTSNYICNQNMNLAEMGNVSNCYEKKAVECDAYYGDGSPYVSAFRNENKPIMIQNYEVKT